MTETLAQEVGAGVHAVRVPMAPGGLPYSLCYLVEDASGRIHVVDPGSAGAGNLAWLTEALQGIGHGMRTVASIVVTHLHPDHLGLAFDLSAAAGAPILLHERERDALLGVGVGAGNGDGDGDGGWPTAPDPAARLDGWGVPDERRQELFAAMARPAVSAAVPDGAAERIVGVADGELLPVPGRSIRVLWTPGHTAGHLCLDDADNGMLFTGDHVLPTVNPGIGLGAGFTRNPIAAYLESLERVAALGERTVAPGHERVFGVLGERCDELSRHHLRRTREVVARLAKGDEPSVWQIARSLTWTGGWEGLGGFTLLSALAQTAMHAEFARSADARRYVGAG
ncbi:MBL fold metallo-hydrolase [Leifsonia sp. NPDC102414]|uniref:MBL fold metallo-hydrolase n=1 Tax=Leifsonia sp. NPDC102414 TaxID=3364124 RepID=UPI003802FC62